MYKQCSTVKKHDWNENFMTSIKQIYTKTSPKSRGKRVIFFVKYLQFL